MESLHPKHYDERHRAVGGGGGAEGDAVANEEDSESMDLVGNNCQMTYLWVPPMLA